MTSEQSPNWFEVDREGLAKLLGRKGKSFVLFELIQNAWDTDASQVEIHVGQPENGLVKVTVSDDNPAGFSNLSHAWTLFAESEKKNDPNKRGRFNLGEKLILAICESATLTTTKGQIIWSKEKGRYQGSGRKKKGTTFAAIIPMDLSERTMMLNDASKMIPPPSCKTFVNGKVLYNKIPKKTISTTLQTEVADENGFLKRLNRRTAVEVYEPTFGEEAMIYEMGVPIVESGGGWHINVMQKVPLNTDRDNVSPAFLQSIRVAVLNEMHEWLEEHEATEKWVREAAADERCSPEATRNITRLRFGEKAVISDPSDPEGTKIAMSKGYEIVFAGAMSKGEWANVRKSSALLPAGKVTPSRSEQFSSYSLVKMTADMRRVERLTKWLASELLNVEDLTVVFLSSPGSNTLADFSKENRQLRYNVANLGIEWFSKICEKSTLHSILDLILHEFGHWESGDHRSALYHEAVTRLGAQLTILALTKPMEFI